MAKRKFDKILNIPVIFYTKLLRLALGIDPTSLGLKTIHKIKIADLLQKVVADNRCRSNL
jgi:heterodisulfide reductase subunit B